MNNKDIDVLRAIPDRLGLRGMDVDGIYWKLPKRSRQGGRPAVFKSLKRLEKLGKVRLHRHRWSSALYAVVV